MRTGWEAEGFVPAVEVLGRRWRAVVVRGADRHRHFDVQKVPWSA